MRECIRKLKRDQGGHRATPRWMRHAMLKTSMSALCGTVLGLGTIDDSPVPRPAWPIYNCKKCMSLSAEMQWPVGHITDISKLKFGQHVTMGCHPYGNDGVVVKVTPDGVEVKVDEETDSVRFVGGYTGILHFDADGNGNRAEGPWEGIWQLEEIPAETLPTIPAGQKSSKAMEWLNKLQRRHAARLANSVTK